MAGASFRANWSKHTLRHLRKLPADKRHSILGEVGDDTLHSIKSAGVLGWLPAEHHARIFDAIRKVLGHTGAVAFWSELMRANFEQPLLRPLVEGAVRLFGATPYSVFRMSPRAWSLVARDCGEHSVARGDAGVEARIIFEQLPPMLVSDGFAAHCEGNCDAVLRFLRVRGVVSVAEQQSGTLVVEVTDVQAASSLHQAR